MGDDLKNTKTALRTGSSQALRQADFELVPEAKRSSGSTERDAMFARLQEIILDGLRHGFFDCLISCELVKDRKRRVVIKAGKSHQFTIREEDLHD
jgi:hypothetical protein